MVSAERQPIRKRQGKESPASKETTPTPNFFAVNITGEIAVGKSTVKKELSKILDEAGINIEDISAGKIYQEMKEKGLKGVALNEATDNEAKNQAILAIKKGKMPIMDWRAFSHSKSDILKEVENGKKSLPIALQVKLEVSRQEQRKRLSERGRLPSVEREFRRQRKLYSDLEKAYPELDVESLMNPQDGYNENILYTSINTDNDLPEAIAQKIFDMIIPESNPVNEAKKPSSRLPRNGTIFHSRRN